MRFKLKTELLETDLTDTISRPLVTSELSEKSKDFDRGICGKL